MFLGYWYCWRYRIVWQRDQENST